MKGDVRKVAVIAAGFLVAIALYKGVEYALSFIKHYNAMKNGTGGSSTAASSKNTEGGAIIDEKFEAIMRAIQSQAQEINRRGSVDESSNTKAFQANADQTSANATMQSNTEIKHPIHLIVLTGGPCAGKTTALARLQSYLQTINRKVFVVPEAATMLMKAGCLIDNTNFTDIDAAIFQTFLIKTQMSLEDIFMGFAVATQDKPTVILCDRGTMDGKAYCSDTVWQAILDESGWSPLHLRDRRYNAVIHMVTAADGAEKFYTGEDNEARYEDVEDARNVDRKLQNAWVGHPDYHIVHNNYDGFDQKINATLQTCLTILGLPSSTIFAKKFLLKPSSKNGFQLPAYSQAVKILIEETFLESDHSKSEIKVIKRGQGAACTYQYEKKSFKLKKVSSVEKPKDEEESKPEETEEKKEEKEEKVKTDPFDSLGVMTTQRQITPRDYVQYVTERKDGGRQKLNKMRQSFIFRKQHIVIDTLLNVENTPSILRIETEKTNKAIVYPPYIEILREITDEDTYQSYNMSRTDYKLPEEDRKMLTDSIMSEVMRDQE